MEMHVVLPDVDEIQYAAKAMLEDVLFSYVALDDTADYVLSMRDHARMTLRGVLEAGRSESSTTLVRGWKIGLRPRRVQVCDCHTAPLHACPEVEAGRPIIVASIVDGKSLYVERPDTLSHFPMLAFGPCASADRDQLDFSARQAKKHAA